MSADAAYQSEYRNKLREEAQAKADVAAAQRMRMIAEAEFGKVRYRQQPVSPQTLKLVLVVIAAHEGQPISNAGIAARTGGAACVAQYATRALELLGVIRIRPNGPNRTNTYTINWETLADFTTEAVRYCIGGVRPRYHDRRHQMDRARKRAKKIASQSLAELGGERRAG